MRSSFHVPRAEGSLAPGDPSNLERSCYVDLRRIAIVDFSVLFHDCAELPHTHRSAREIERSTPGRTRSNNSFKYRDPNCGMSGVDEAVGGSSSSEPSKKPPNGHRKKPSIGDASGCAWVCCPASCMAYITGRFPVLQAVSPEQQPAPQGPAQDPSQPVQADRPIRRGDGRGPADLQVTREQRGGGGADG